MPKPSSLSPLSLVKYKAGIFLLSLLAPVLLFAQIDPEGAILRAYALDEQGKMDNAIALLRPLINSGAFHGAELGRAWIILGVAYADQNEFHDARNAYEQAISILQPMPERIRDYAGALDHFANLYQSEGQLQIATSLRSKTLRIYQQLGDDSRIARDSSVLAGLALQQGQLKEGRRYLKQAAENLKMATELNEDDLAVIFSTRAQFAKVDGNVSAEIAGVEHALQILQRAHEATNPNIGWECMLLGAAYSHAGRAQDALREMRQGLSILAGTWDHNSRRYLEAEIVYSQVLDQSGDHKTAALLRISDEAKLKELQRIECSGCTISADALR
jgi:tetratricopeptide (TPR) repeat protein